MIFALQVPFVILKLSWNNTSSLVLRPILSFQGEHNAKIGRPLQSIRDSVAGVRKDDDCVKSEGPLWCILSLENPTKGNGTTDLTRYAIQTEVFDQRFLYRLE